MILTSWATATILFKRWNYILSRIWMWKAGLQMLMNDWISLVRIRWLVYRISILINSNMLLLPHCLLCLCVRMKVYFTPSRLLHRKKLLKVIFALVSISVTFLSKWNVTEVALKWLFTGMSAQMHCQLGDVRLFLMAIRTLKAIVTVSFAHTSIRSDGSSCRKAR